MDISQNESEAQDEATLEISFSKYEPVVIGAYNKEKQVLEEKYGFKLSKLSQ